MYLWSIEWSDRNYVLLRIPHFLILQYLQVYCSQLNIERESQRDREREDGEYNEIERERERYKGKNENMICTFKKIFQS